MRVFVALTITIVLSLLSHHTQADTLQWCGQEWIIKHSKERFGPGPNLWSKSSDSVWVDGQGRLNLKIRKIGETWYSAEVYTLNPLGHGKYVFYLDSRVDNLDPNVVVGLFVHSDDMNEIDIEFSKWGKERKKYTYHQFVLQPRIDDTNLKRTDYWVKNPLSTHGFLWSTESVIFRSFVGHDTNKKPHKYWDYVGSNNPTPSSERAHINLWLFKGRPPINEKETTLVINKFVYVPLDKIEDTDETFTADTKPQAAKKN